MIQGLLCAGQSSNLIFSHDFPIAQIADQVPLLIRESKNISENMILQLKNEELT